MSKGYKPAQVASVPEHHKLFQLGSKLQCPVVISAVRDGFGMGDKTIVSGGV